MLICHSNQWLAVVNQPELALPSPHLWAFSLFNMFVLHATKELSFWWKKIMNYSTGGPPPSLSNHYIITPLMPGNVSKSWNCGVVVVVSVIIRIQISFLLCSCFLCSLKREYFSFIDLSLYLSLVGEQAHYLLTEKALRSLFCDCCIYYVCDYKGGAVCFALCVFLCLPSSTAFIWSPYSFTASRILHRLVKTLKTASTSSTCRSL